jgi:polynucleotide 5'-hydroxyl-kinase GRC3/NOL9
VRAIDPSQHALLLLTPLPLSALEKVSGLVKGELQLPLWAMLDHQLGKGSGVANVPWNKVPYITQESTEGAGANALRVRRNLLRRSQA